MPKAKRTHAINARTKATATALSPAEALIASASTGLPSDPSPEAIKALRKIFAHNDTRPTFGPCGRVSRSAAVKMLQTQFGWPYGEHALEGLSRRLGRRSWGTP